MFWLVAGKEFGPWGLEWTLFVLGPLTCQCFEAPLIARQLVSTLDLRESLEIMCTVEYLGLCSMKTGGPRVTPPFWTPLPPLTSST